MTLSQRIREHLNDIPGALGRGIENAHAKIMWLVEEEIRALLAECKHQREQIAKLREALDQFCRRVAPTGNVDARIVGAAFGERMQQTYSQARALLRELGEDA